MIVVQGKKTADMKGKDDYYSVVEVVPGDGIMQDPDRVRLQAGRPDVSTRCLWPHPTPMLAWPSPSEGGRCWTTLSRFPAWVAVSRCSTKR